jgi:predicted HD superfamily hydrolase involved in NAD metabolism
MEDKTLLKIRKKLKKEIDESRYNHTLGVMYTASCLAMAHGIDPYPAQLAGLLHDCAKCIPDKQKFQMCEKYNIVLTQSEIANPKLIHAKLGAYLAQKEYGISDPEIQSAIRYHTTGCPNMTLLEKIIYIADYIEPNRATLPNFPEVRRLAFSDIDAALYQILEDSLSYLSGKNNVVDPMTEATYNYYKNLNNLR